MTLFESGGTLILGGLPDAGKTYALIQLATAGLDPRKSVILSLEYQRTKDCYDTHFAGLPVEIINCMVVNTTTTKEHKRGSLNTVLSYEKFKSELDKIISNIESYYIIGVDGISDLRRYCVDKWIADYNKANPGKTRTKIGKEDLGAWAEVNDEIISDFVEPLQNLATSYNCIVCYTAKTKGVYNKSNIKIGVEVDIHVKIGHLVSVICELQRDNQSYYVSIVRSIRGSTGLKQYSTVSPAPEYKITGSPLWEVLMECKV